MSNKIQDNPPGKDNVNESVELDLIAAVDQHKQVGSSQELGNDLDYYEEEVPINWAKKLDLPDIDYQKVIKKSSQKKLSVVTAYVDQTKQDIDQYRIDQEKSLQLRYEQMVEKVKSDITKKYLKQLTDFTVNTGLYFDLLEDHCVTILKRSLEVLGKEVDDRGRLLSSVKAASASIKDEGKVTLRINPEQINEVDSLPLAPSWSVEQDATVAKGNCRFDVPLGQHSSQFDTTFNTLLGLIEP